MPTKLMDKSVKQLSLYRFMMSQKQENNTSRGKPLKILIVIKFQSEPQNLVLVNRVIAAFVQEMQAVFYFVDEAICQKMSELDGATTYRLFNKKQHSHEIDFVFTVGGDGTILFAAKQFQKITPPFLTIQKGTLGFLCKFRPDDIQDIVHKIAQQTNNKHRPKDNHQHHQHHQHHQLPNHGSCAFEVCKLMRLTAAVVTRKQNEQILLHTKIVLNQVAITRKDNNRISLQIFIDGEPVTTTSGDGILVSTPTGSTAYALSAGGPVVLNGVNTILLVPIAPNSLSFRPICLPSASVVKIKLSNKSKSNALVSFDGQSNIQLTENDQISIWYEEGEKNRDLILYQPKTGSTVQNENLPTWMQRLKLFLGWNQVFKSPACEVMAKNLDKIQ